LYVSKGIHIYGRSSIFLQLPQVQHILSTQIDIDEETKKNG